MAKRTAGRGLTSRMRPARRDEPSRRVCDGSVVVFGAKDSPTALVRAPLLEVSALARALFDVSAGGRRTCRSPLRKHYARWSITGALVERSGDFGGLEKRRHHCRFVVLQLVWSVLASERMTRVCR